MSYDTVHLRDDVLMMADAFHEIEIMDRIRHELNVVSLQRAHELYSQLMELVDSDQPIPPATHKRLLDVINQAKEELAMK